MGIELAAALLRRNRAVLVLLAAVLLTPPASHPAAATDMRSLFALDNASTTAGIDPGIAEVQFDLGARTFTKVLPFDVPFHLAGKTPSGAQKIELYYFGSPTTIPLTRTSPDPKHCGPAEIVINAKDKDGKDAKWLPAGTWTRSPVLDPQTQGTFVLAVPPLEALQYYVFEVRIESFLAQDKITNLQNLAHDLFDKRLDGVQRSADLARDDVTSLRDGLVGDVGSVLGAGNFIAPRSFFDPCLDFSSASDLANVLRERFLNDLNPLLQEQDNIAHIVEDLAATRLALQTLLEQIRKNDKLRDALVRLDAAVKTGDAATKLFLDRDGGLNSVTVRMPAGVESDLLGPMPPTTAPASIALDRSYLASVGQTYTNALTRLNLLYNWLDALVSLGQTEEIRNLPLDDLRAIGALNQGAVRSAKSLVNLRLSRLVSDLKNQFLERDKALVTLAQKVAAMAAGEVTIDASTTGTGNTFQNYFITADLGLLYGWEVSKLLPYGGANIYLRPVNSDVPLSQLRRLGRNTFLYRFSFTLGYTLQPVANANDTTRKDLFGGGSLVVGAGFRLTDSVRLSAGALIFIKENPNPLITSETVGAAPYLSFSFDWKVAKTLAVIGKTFFANQ